VEPACLTSASRVATVKEDGSEISEVAVVAVRTSAGVRSVVANCALNLVFSRLRVAISEMYLVVAALAVTDDGIIVGPLDTEGAGVVALLEDEVLATDTYDR
jgi:hypothetical protein